jgi:hypothetical protein
MSLSTAWTRYEELNLSHYTERLTDSELAELERLRLRFNDAPSDYETTMSAICLSVTEAQRPLPSKLRENILRGIQDFTGSNEFF